MESIRRKIIHNPKVLGSGLIGFLVGGIGYHFFNKLNKNDSEPGFSQTKEPEFVLHETDTPTGDKKNSTAEKAFRVAVTGAGGQIAYSFLPLLASGQVFGPNVSIELRLLDIPQAEKAMEAVKLELEDGAYPLLLNIVTGTNPQVIFEEADVVIFLGGYPRKKGQERKELLEINGKIFKEQGEALNLKAKKTVKCLVVANPANTNCLILKRYAPDIPATNFTCLTRLDHNRALSQIASKTGKPVSTIKNVIIWGNHSATQYPDVNHGTIQGEEIKKVVNDEEYLKTDLISRVQKRGAEIIGIKGTSSVFSAANAVKDHLRDWYHGTPNGEWVSMGVYSTGDAYNIPEDIIFSFPVTCKDFEYTIVKGLNIDEFSRELIQLTLDELLAEKKEAFNEEI